MTPPGPISVLPDGSVRIDASTSLASLATDALLRERFPLLATASVTGATPDVSLADDLAQRGRCPFLQANAPCLKNGGTECFAIEHDNRLLAIIEGGPSWLVHPSQAGVALVALDAQVEIADASGGTRTVGARDFFLLPTQRLDAETVLTPHDRIVAVHLDADVAFGIQRYDAVLDDSSGAVLASLAAVRRVDGDVRLVLGGVSPRPYRVYNSIEEETTSGGLDEDTIEGLAERALLDAAPLSENGYKVELAAELLRDAIRVLARN